MTPASTMPMSTAIEAMTRGSAVSVVTLSSVGLTRPAKLLGR